MSDPKPEAPHDETDQAEYLEDQLEEGLEDSFPASDPPSVARRHRQPPHNPS
ncbi:hypothetical protein [Caulobacter endophyticus]|uniref:hypothetical protein n=1 Tax=Caulobacter endophyticus TaxID=2172652 RepID=UPI0018EEAFFD|nr:hypothetical protein [Caulobacter endophyticus]